MQKTAVRVLLVDNSDHRKEKIALLKGSGITVFPSRSLQQARQRCAPGKYDLIIVNADADPGLAVAVCDDILSQNREQRLLLLVALHSRVADRPYAVMDTAEIWLEAVRAMFGMGASSTHIAEAA